MIFLLRSYFSASLVPDILSLLFEEVRIFLLGQNHERNEAIDNLVTLLMHLSMQLLISSPKVFLRLLEEMFFPILCARKIDENTPRITSILFL